MEGLAVPSSESCGKKLVAQDSHSTKTTGDINGLCGATSNEDVNGHDGAPSGGAVNGHDGTTSTGDLNGHGDSISTTDINGNEDKFREHEKCDPSGGGAMYRLPGEYEYDGMIMDHGKKVEHLEYIRHELDFRKDDVICAGFPKSGQTWICEIVHRILNKDNPEALHKPVTEKWIFIELCFPPHNPGVKRVRESPSPRYVKTHLPARYFTRAFGPDGPKIVVPMRNPKDNLVSLYHFYRMNRGLGNYSGTWDEFFELHRNGRLYYENMFTYNTGWTEQPNVYVVKYEDMQKDIRGQIKTLAKFLNTTVTEGEIDFIVQATSMDTMRNKKDSSAGNLMIENKRDFFRKGKVGDWKNYFSAEQSAYIDDEYSAKAESITFDFEI